MWLSKKGNKYDSWCTERNFEFSFNKLVFRSNCTDIKSGKRYTGFPKKAHTKT